jgi:hypothetical protein
VKTRGKSTELNKFSPPSTDNSKAAKVEEPMAEEGHKEEED